MQTLIASHRLVAQPLQPLKIVAIGDSLIYGFGDPTGGGWVERLRRLWMTPDGLGHAMYNLGIRGDGVKQVAQRLEGEFRHRGELRNRVPDLMILSVGVNDSARLNRPNGRNFTEFEAFEQDLATLLDRATQLCPVLFVGMVPVDETKMPFLDCLYYNHADQFRYKRATQTACAERQIPYLDVFSRWMERGDVWCREQMLDDGLHPNVSGYQALLEDVMSWPPFDAKVAAIAPL
ncbi:MAG: GDSL-type esterase/lipase family protein [Leptolyngbyaceae cyanobacterium bins.349]|nr:GDSL-type esterase/lipase family protein [Leptolyngbyaceae cyanobacterium bins.349]